jgi:GNAT superfamily N-acetyltransferase
MSDLPSLGSIFRQTLEADQSFIFKHEHEPVGDWLLEFRGEIVATGGYLTHYNPPYVDIYMEVRDDMRRRGLGSYLVQEIKRVAGVNKKIPCGRCNLDNVGSMKAMVRAGMTPCAHRVEATIKSMNSR